MRANPFHSYRGFRYYTTAGVYRLSLPDGSKEAFGAKRGGLHALQNYVDAYIDELAADQSLARNPRPLSKAEKAQRAKKRPVTPRSLALLSHIERRGAGAGKHHTRTRDEETGRARRPKHGGREAYIERENPKTLDFVVKAGWYGSGYPDLDDATLERAKREIGATRFRRTTEGNVPAVVFSVLIPDWASGGAEGVARSIESILNRYGRVSGLFQSPDPFYVSRAKSRKARPTDEEMDASYAEMNVKEARRKAAQKRPPPEVTPRKRLASKGSARPKYPLDLRENPLSGKAGLHIVAKRRAPDKRGAEYSFSYSTRGPMTGIGVTPSGRTYATRKYGEDWKANAEDFLSEYDDGYYADATLKIFARDDSGVDHPLTLSAVRSMAKSGSLPARRATNPRHR